MHGLKLLSIILLISGGTVFAIGLWLYWITNPVSEWASAFTMIGLLFLLGAIILLCIGQQYDVA